MKEITEELTSDETVSGYVIKLTESLFPQGPGLLFISKQVLVTDFVTNSLIDRYKKLGKGYPALPKEKRSENEVILTGLFCRAKLMTAIPENLRHMLGK